MRKGILLFAILAIIVLPFLIPLFAPSFYQSHDGEAHVARFGAYYKAFSDGQFPPRWAGDLNYKYGSPVFIFYYPLPGSIAAGLHALGITLEHSFKLLMIISFVLGPTLFYLWASSIVRKEVAVASALFYGLAPYHFLDMYVRGDVAEMLGFVFVPLVFLSIEKIIKKPDVIYAVQGGIFYSLLILSHNSLSLMFSPVFLTYGMIKVRDGKTRLLVLLFLILGLGLSSFFWIPAFRESKFVMAERFIGDMYRDHFPSLLSLVYSEWGFDPDINKSGGLSPQIGPLHIAMVLFGVFVFFKKTKDRVIVGCWLLLFALSLFLSIPLSMPVWQDIQLLKLFQFPWRFTGLSSFAASVLSLYVFNSYFDKKILFVCVLVLVVLSIPLTKVQYSASRKDSYYFEYSGTTYYHGQASTIWTAGDPSQFPNAYVEIISGKGKIVNVIKKSNIHFLEVDAENNIKLLDNTVFFPGWRVSIDGKRVPIEFQDMNHRGLITFDVSKGIHNIVLAFGESSIRLIADIISLMTVCGSILLLMLHRQPRKNLQGIR